MIYELRYKWEKNTYTRDILHVVLPNICIALEGFQMLNVVETQPAVQHLEISRNSLIKV